MGTTKESAEEEDLTMKGTPREDLPGGDGPLGTTPEYGDRDYK